MNPDAQAVDLPAVDDAFCVIDAGSANWVVRKIVEARRYAKLVKAWAEAELRRAEREEEFFRFRFGGQLEQWARSELAMKHGNGQSISLPAGRIGFRLQPTRLDIEDETALMAWCERCLPDAIVVSRSLSKSLIMQHITQTGET